jgi:hypothetical protein
MPGVRLLPIGETCKEGGLNMQSTETCPFKVGDTVIYRPSFRGRALNVMTDLAELKPDGKYKVARVESDYYVVVEGSEDSSGGGLYWTEFSAAS